MMIKAINIVLMALSIGEVHGLFFKFNPRSFGPKPFKHGDLQLSRPLLNLNIPKLPNLNIFDGGSVGNGNNGGNGNDGNGDMLSGGDEGEPHSFAAAGIVTLVKSAVESYGELLDEYPYATKIISSGVVGGFGDTLVQSLLKAEKKDYKFDFRRLLIFMSVCAFYIAPMLHNFFNFLSSLPIPEGTNKFVTALIMISIDQTVGATLINAGFFFFFEMMQRFFPPYTEHDTSFVVAGYDAIQKNLWKTLLASWKIWPFLNFINFLVVPLQFRVLYANLASVFWNMILSSIANS